MPWTSAAAWRGLPRWFLVPAGIAVVFLALPLVGMAARVPWTQLPALVTSPAAMQALGLSLRTCLLSTTLCLVFGVPLAMVLARTESTVGRVVRGLVTLPMVLPPVVAGLALLTTLGRRGLLGVHLSLAGIEVGFTTLAVIIAQAFIALPFLVISLDGALRSMETGYEEVAATLGAHPTLVWWRVSLPLMAPALTSSAALAFARALGEFGATLTFAGSLPGITRTLPLEIYLTREDSADSALALALVLLLVAMLIVALTTRSTARRTP